MLGQRDIKELSLTSKDVIFNVKEIPTQNRPEDTGAVGEFMTSTNIDSKEEGGEPITLTVEMSGEDSFSRIPLLKFRRIILESLPTKQVSKSS